MKNYAQFHEQHRHGRISMDVLRTKWNFSSDILKKELFNVMGIIYAFKWVVYSN